MSKDVFFVSFPLDEFMRGRFEAQRDLLLIGVEDKATRAAVQRLPVAVLAASLAVVGAAVLDSMRIRDRSAKSAHKILKSALEALKLQHERIFEEVYDDDVDE